MKVSEYYEMMANEPDVDETEPEPDESDFDDVEDDEDDEDDDDMDEELLVDENGNSIPTDED